MSWHPYDRTRRVWTIYWGERTNPQPDQNVVEFELTEPYALDRDVWRDMQLDFMLEVTPVDHYVNLSQLWSRLWPPDGALRFTKIGDLYNIPIIISAALDYQEQPGKRKDFFWVMAQLLPERAKLEDLIFFQNIDLENITWITKEPLAPWPDQVFQHNQAAFAWNKKLLKGADFDRIVQRECWGVSVTHLGHLDFLTTRGRRTPEFIFEILNKLAAKYELEIEFTTFAERPRKPGLGKTLAELPGNFVHDGWEQLKRTNRRRP